MCLGELGGVEAAKIDSSLSERFVDMECCMWMLCLMGRVDGAELSVGVGGSPLLHAIEQ